MYTGKFILSANEKSADAIKLRAQIPEFAAASDAHDSMAIYALVYDEGEQLSGAGRLYIDDDSHFRIDLVGVVPKKRGQYMGDLMARMLLYRAQELNAPSVYLTAPENVIRFFARYGFVAVARHDGLVDMKVDAPDIRLEGSCSRGKGAPCSGNCAECE